MFQNLRVDVLGQVAGGYRRFGTNSAHVCVFLALLCVIWVSKGLLSVGNLSFFMGCSVRLPRLPFGEDDSVVENDIRHYSERFASVLPNLHVGALGEKSKFAYKSHTLVVNGLPLVASSHTPLYVGVDGVSFPTLLIPFHGGGKSTSSDGQAEAWSTGHAAAFFPAGARGSTSTETRSCVTLNLNPQRLQAVASSMLGRQDAPALNLDILDSRIVRLVHPRVSFDAIFRNLCAQVDAWRHQPGAMEKMGLDDMFYRYAVIMLKPELFLRSALDTPDRQAMNVSERAITLLCEQLAAQLNERITLTDMERMSGLSARSLQYAFLRKFACTPMQWLRTERLARARRMLMQPPAIATVTSIAQSCGFGDSSQLAAVYLPRYGELPSDTLDAKKRERIA
jgi:AraC-like DNA-binding protein